MILYSSLITTVGGVTPVSITGSRLGSVGVPPVTGTTLTGGPPGPVKGGTYGVGSVGSGTGIRPIVTIASLFKNSASPRPVAVSYTHLTLPTTPYV